MSNEMSSAAYPEVTFHHAPSDSDSTIKKIIRTTVILSVITLIELALGFIIYYMHKNPDFNHTMVLFIKGVIVILSISKAFYIVSVFMHLGDEIRNLIMTIVVPLLIFIWFIGAFLYEGNAWKDLRNTRGGSVTYPEQQVTAPADAKKPGVE
jgi:cytochrome c oxidase subunit IV